MYQRHSGQDPRELATGHGVVHPFAGDQVLLPDVPFLLLDGSQGTQTDGDVLAAYRLFPDGRPVPLLRQRVAARLRVGYPAHHVAVRVRCHCRLHLSPDRRHVNRPSVEEPADGRRVQRGERVFHAGDPVDGERVFGEPSDPFLLQEEVA